jgi:hypothetical protein
MSTVPKMWYCIGVVREGQPTHPHKLPTYSN